MRYIPMSNHPSSEYLISKVKFKLLYLLAASLFLTYVLVRAFSVGATIDEITTMEVLGICLF